MYKVITKTMSMLKNNTVLAVNEKIFVKEKNAQKYANIWKKFSNMQVSIKKLTIDLGHSVSLRPF